MHYLNEDLQAAIGVRMMMVYKLGKEAREFALDLIGVCFF